MMRYGVNDYGLLLSDDTMKYLAAKICDDYSDDEYKEDKHSFNDAVVETIGLEYISEFSGDAVRIAADGSDDWYSENNFSGDIIYYVPFSHYPNLFNVAYSDMKSIINEMKGKIGKYLSEDFDYRSNIRHIVGTYYG